MPETEIADIFHDSIEPRYVHAPYSFTFNNKLERTSTVVGLNDVGKFARQLDDGSIWVLWDIAPTWKRLLTEGVPTPPEGPAGGGLRKFYPNPEVVPDSHIHTPGVSIPAYPLTLPPSGPVGGPHFQGWFPNPELKETGVIASTYINPTLKIDTWGRVVEATSGLVGEVNTGLNLGYGHPIYKGKANTELQFHTLLSKSGSGLEWQLSDTDLTLDTPGLAKLSGAEFEGDVSCPLLDTRDLTVTKLYVQGITNVGSGTNWVPQAENGSIQVREFVGSGTIAAISGAPVGMHFKFYLNLVNGSVPIGFDTEYALDRDSARIPLPGMNVLEGVVITPYLYDCRLRVGLQ